MSTSLENIPPTKPRLCRVGGTLGGRRIVIDRVTPDEQICPTDSELNSGEVLRQRRRECLRQAQDLLAIEIGDNKPEETSCGQRRHGGSRVG